METAAPNLDNLVASLKDNTAKTFDSMLAVMRFAIVKSLSPIPQGIKSTVATAYSTVTLPMAYMLSNGYPYVSVLCEPFVLYAKLFVVHWFVWSNLSSQLPFIELLLWRLSMMFNFSWMSRVLFLIGLSAFAYDMLNTLLPSVLIKAKTAVKNLFGSGKVAGTTPKKPMVPDHDLHSFSDHQASGINLGRRTCAIHGDRHQCTPRIRIARNSQRASGKALDVHGSEPSSDGSLVSEWNDEGQLHVSE